MYVIHRSTEEIDEQMNLASEAEERGGSSFPGMSFEEGVAEALRWIIGDSNDKPIDPAEVIRD